MNSKLTEQHAFVTGFDPLAADVYMDIKFYSLFKHEIAKYRNLTLSEVKCSYDKARELLKNREQAWLYGLSNRAKLAIVATGKYNDFKCLYDDVMTNNEDLEDLPRIGHKVAVEVHGWIIKNKAC